MASRFLAHIADGRPLISYTLAAATTAPITSVIGVLSSCRKYMIEFQLMPSQDDVELWLRVSTNNGVSYDAAATDYRFGQQGIPDNAGVVAFNGTGSGSDAIKIGEDTSGQSVGNQANEGISGKIIIERLGDASAHPLFQFNAEFINANGNAVRSVGGGSRSAAAAINAVQLLFEGGTMTGTVDVYELAI